MSEPDAAVETVGERDTVELTVPADTAYVSVLRTVTASLAARRDFTIEEIDDLRIAVDEASALLLPLAGPRSTLTASFAGASDELEVQVILTAAEPAADGIDESSFAWMVLAALADEVHAERDTERVGLTLVKKRALRG